MKSEVDSPSLWQLRCRLLSAVDFAEDFGNNRPEYATPLTRFSQEIRRIKKELMSSFEEGSAPQPLYEIVNALMGARTIAEIMAERNPEKSGPFTRCVEDLKHAHEELIRTVRPNVNPLAV